MVNGCWNGYIGFIASLCLSLGRTLIDADSVPGHRWVVQSFPPQGVCCGAMNTGVHGPYVLGCMQDIRVQTNEPAGWHLGKQPSASF